MPGNDLKINSNGKMESWKLDIPEGYFGNEFPSICRPNHCGAMAA